jgi:hypothetical protein
MACGSYFTECKKKEKEEEKKKGVKYESRRAKHRPHTKFWLVSKFSP